MPAHNADDLVLWLKELRAANNVALFDAASAFATQIMGLTPSTYRDQAICKFTDAVTFALVAARQP